jgi:hypothetical protein
MAGGFQKWKSASTTQIDVIFNLVKHTGPSPCLLLLGRINPSSRLASGWDRITPARAFEPSRPAKRAVGAPKSGGDHALDGRAGQAKTVGYRFVGDMAAVNIQARPEMGILRHGREAMVR